jgi:transcriptional regulator with XRE-family HTH domain
MPTRTGDLGAYLKDRRGKLDPAAFGLPATRRRTSGLRREEVAQGASISPTWYTWLEQGRGGAPSAPVLDRIADALMLTAVEREHLFLIALGHLPKGRFSEAGTVTLRLQRVLDALSPSPAMIRNALWDVVAWNSAVPVMLTDYGQRDPKDRNILRAIFLDPEWKSRQDDWRNVARFVVGAFRIDAARSGATEAATALIDELRGASPEFAALWAETEIPSPSEVVKTMKHPVLGSIRFEYSVFAVDGRPDLSMVVYNPVDPRDLARLAALSA